MSGILRIARKLPPQLGGQEFHVADLSRQQAAQTGGKVHIDFAMGNPVDDERISCRRVLPHRLVSAPGSDSFQACLFAFGFVARNFVRPLADIGIVHVHGDIFEIAAAALVARRYKVPLVATLHAGLSRRKWYRILASRILMLPDALICVSSDIVDRVKSMTGGRNHVYSIHSGIDRALFLGQPRRACHALARIVSIGRLHPMKGHRTLLATAANSAIRDRIAVDIVGDGPLAGELKALADDLGVNVRFLGRKTKAEIAEILAQADIFVSSSVQLAEQTEGTPTVIMEAMAAGLPVVATDIGGARAIVRHGENGLIVAQSDPQAAAAALDRLISDSGLFARMSARNVVDSVAFDWATVGGKIAVAYGQAIGENVLNRASAGGGPR